MSSLSKEHSMLSRETIQNAFSFPDLCPFLDLNFLSSINYPTAKHLAPACSALVICGFKKSISKREAIPM